MRRLIIPIFILLFSSFAYGGFGGYLQANTAVDLMIGPFVDDTDGKTAETGLTVTQAEVRLSKNGGNMAQKNEATSLTHDELGNYVCKLDTTDTNTEGILTIMVHESGALPIKMEFMVLAQATYISLVTAKDAGFMDVNLKTIGRTDTQETETNNLESACSNYSVTRGLTGTALPAAVADAAGGVPISDDGGVDLDELYDGIVTDAQGTNVAEDVALLVGTDGKALISTDAQDMSGTLSVNTKTFTAGSLANATFNADVGSTAHGTNIIALAARKILEELNLDHLLKVTTGVAADSDLESYVVAGTVMSHVMGVAADVTTFKASEDSLEMAGAVASTDNWESQSNTDPTGFKVNVMEVNGTAQTANDMSGDSNTIVTAVEKIDTSTELRTLLTGADTPVCKDSTPLTAAEAEAEAYDAIELANLDHWMKVVTSNSATLPEVVDDTVLANILTKTDGDTSDYDFTLHSFEALRDRGDAAWTTGGGTGLTPLASDTAQGGSASTIQLADAETFANDELNGNVVLIHTGTGAGQSRLIYDYTNANDTADVTPNWTTNPDNTSQYEVWPASVNVERIERTDATDAINTEADNAIVTYELDHLVAVADADDPANDSIVAKMFSSDGDWSGADKATDSLEALRDRGDAAWTSSATAIIYTTYHVPFVIDIAGTATIRFGMVIADAIDDLPSTAEITPGTIKIERKPINGTTWATIVNDEACLEAAGLIYYDEVLDTASGYREEDALRITFKSQKVVIGGNDFEITGTNGAIFHSYIRKALPDVIYRPW